MRFLCDEIGNRLAGGPGEERAAEYFADRFRETGLANVELLPFATKRRLPGEGVFHTLDDPARALTCQPIAHSVSTGPEGIEGDLVFLEKLGRVDRLRRKVAVLLHKRVRGGGPTGA